MSTLTSPSERRRALLTFITTCVLIPLAVANCGQIGGGAGLNQNEQSSGNREGGVDLSWDQIAIDPTGAYFISNRQSQVIYGDIKTGESKILKDLSDVTRLAFGRDQVIYCDAFYRGAHVLVAYDLHEERVLWSISELSQAELGRSELSGFTTFINSRIDISNDQTRLIVTGVFGLRVVDVRDGRVMFETSFDHPIMDVDVHPTEDRVLVTLNHEWIDELPQTELLSLSWEGTQRDQSSGGPEIGSEVAETGEETNDEVTPAVISMSPSALHAELKAVRRPLTQTATEMTQPEPSHDLKPTLSVTSPPQITKIVIPNCSSELTLTPDGKRAFLAPTNCRKDPVSVIDLVADRFVRNLPGFGPVAMSPSGETAIAFINMNNVEEHLFDDPTQIPNKEDGVYHLMLINVSDLSFKTIPLGNRLPRYALTPNGQMILIDKAYVAREDASVRILDVDTLTLQPVSGPSVRLLHFVLTSDSSRALLIDEHLYELSITERRVEQLPLSVTPSRLNITPDDKHLIIRSKADRLWVYDLAARQMSHQIDLPPSFYDHAAEYYFDERY